MFGNILSHSADFWSKIAWSTFWSSISRSTDYDEAGDSAVDPNSPFERINVGGLLSNESGIPDYGPLPI